MISPVDLMVVASDAQTPQTDSEANGQKSARCCFNSHRVCPYPIIVRSLDFDDTSVMLLLILSAGLGVDVQISVDLGRAGERHTPALGVPGVLHVSAQKRFQKMKPKFTAYPLMKLKFSGVFELLSVRAVH